MCRRELELPTGGSIYYWSNLAIDPQPVDAGCHAAVERVVLVQHGNSRNPWSYFDTIQEAATLAGEQSTTLIVATWFPAEEDGPPSGFHVWDPGGSGWKSGDASLTDPATSSFAVYDRIILDYLFDRAVYPALEDIVVDTEWKFMLMGAAFYEDTYERRDGRWLLWRTTYRRSFEVMFPTSSIEGFQLTASWWGTDGQSILPAG